MSNTKRFIGFMCSVKLVDVFDEVIKGTYAHRTDALRDSMRDLIRKLEEDQRQKEVATSGT